MSGHNNLKLFTLVAQKGGFGPVISPHVWKTILDLDYLSVKYVTVGQTFSEIRTDLTELTGIDKITVPTLYLGHDKPGRYLAESFKIAEYLENEYATYDRTLFGGMAGKKFARYIEHWVTHTFAPVTRPLLVPYIVDIVDGPSRDYLINTRLPSPERYHQYVALRSDAVATSAWVNAARDALKPINALLCDPFDGPYIHGTKPGHGDFVLFGEYAYARMNPVLIEKVWESEELQGVKAWVDMFLKSGLVDTKLLFTS